MPCFPTIGKKYLTGLMLLFSALILGAVASGLDYREAHASPGPDLVVQDISLSPAEPVLGYTLTITVTVKNQGTATAGSSYVACYINDIILNSVSIGSIDAGSMRTASFTWTAQAGSHTIKAVVDSTGMIAEDDEINNTKTYNLTTLAADLIVESILCTPENPSKGDAIVFSVTVKNQGNTNSPASTVHFYTGDVCRGFRDIPILEPGQTATRSFDWMAPASQQIVRAVVDEADTVREANENNNEKSITFSTLPPDLIIKDITWEPETVSRNDEIVFTTTVTNQGTGRADSCHLAYYIDSEFYSAVKIPSLEAGASKKVFFDWKVISDQFEFKAVIDLYGDIFESEEKNNEKKVNVFTIAPDLVIKDLSWTPENAAVGDTLTFQVTVLNQGAGKAGASHLSYSIGNTHSGYVNIPPLGAGEDKTVPFQWETELDTLALNVRVVADYNNRIAETIEYNNSKSLTVVLLLPDIVVPSITWSPKNPSVGETVTFTVNIANQGYGKTGIFHVGYYIDDTLIDTDPVYTAELASTSVNKTCTWEAQMGLHTFKAVADCNRVITESNENNNTASITVVPNMPDLYISNAVWSPVDYKAGDEVTFSVSVRNQGSIKSNPCRLACYADGKATGYRDIDQIAPGAIITEEFLWIAAGGPHAITFVVDTNDTVNEFDETNNSRTVLLPPPDLVIQGLTWPPSDAAVGDTVTLTAAVTNQGSGKAHEPRLTIYVDDVVFKILDFPVIDAGQTVSRSYEWTVEAPGHNIRLYIDEGNFITESDETNNEKTFVFTPLSPDLVLESVKWAMENALLDNEVTFTAAVKNQGNYAAGASQLSCYVDDVLLETRDVKSLGPGETATLTFVTTVEAGLHKLKMVADSAKQVIESDETNNERELPFTTMAPDVLVKNITLSPVIAYVGDTVTVTVKLENRGRDTAVNTSLDLHINGTSLGVTDIEEIGVGEIVTRDYNWIVEEGFCEFIAYVDLEELVLENNKDNNTFSRTQTFTLPEETDEPVINIAVEKPDTGIISDLWLIIIVAAALLGGAAFFIAFKAFKKE